MPKLNRRHIALITAYSVRQALRSGAGLVFLLLSLFFSLSVAQAIITPIEHILKTEEARHLGPDAAQVVQRLIDFGRPVVEWAVGGEEQRAWVAYLLQERPALLSVIFLILLFGMPFVIPVGAFNQTAGEIGNRGIRYLLARTERSNIFAGRFLATVLLTLIAYAFSITTITLYLGLKLQLYGAWELISWSLLGYLALAVQALPYIALCAWISARNESPMPSLVISSLIIGGVLFTAFLAGLYWAPATYLKWLLPWGIQNDLLAPRGYQVALATAACLLYTAVFLALGHRYFCKRDL